MNTAAAEAMMTNLSHVTESSPKSIRASIRNTDVVFHQLFNLYLMSVVLVVGVIANIIIIIIMRDGRFRKLPISVYFTALAISDTVVLCLIAGMQFMKQTTGSYYFISTSLCTTCGFLSNFATGTSSWFIVCVALDRLFVVKFPLKAKTFSTKSKAVVALTVVTAIVFLMNTHFIYMVDYSTTNCQFLPVFKPHRPIAGMIFAVGMNLLPLCLTCLCYIILVALVIKKGTVVPSSNNSAMKERVTKTSLYICLAFMILTTPVAVYVMLNRQNGWNRNPTKFTLMFSTLSNFLRQLNYSVNFFINIGTNSQFREAVYQLFKKGKLAPLNSVSNTTE